MILPAHEELELKAVVADPHGLVQRLEAAGATLAFAGRMEDRRYDRSGELGSGDGVLRTRLMLPESGAPVSVLGWKGPTTVTREGYKRREELEYTVSEGPPDALLLALGYTVVHAISRRIRTYRVGAATVRLEHYPLMDVLVEIEGPPAAIERAIETSGIPRDQFMADSLADFVARFERRTGRRAEMADFHDR